jgi:DNA-directed RNA polymerase subunit RPC12/RpoP
VTTRPFRPRHPIEFSARGALHAPLQARVASAFPRPPHRTSRSSSRPSHIYTYRCLTCGREFEHSKHNSSLRAHKNQSGYPCRGRRATLVGQSWG